MVTNAMDVLQRENARLKIDNQALQHETNQLHEFVDILNTLTTEGAALVTDEALFPLLRTIFVRSLDLLNAPEGSLLLLDEDSNELQFVLVRGDLAGHLLDYRIPANEGIAGWVIQNAEAALVRDVRHDQRFSDSIDEKFKFRTQSIVAVPLIGDGKVFGVLEALNQPADAPFSDIDLHLLHLICRFAGELFINIEHHSR